MSNEKKIERHPDFVVIETSGTRGTGTASRMKAHNEVYKATRNPRLAIRAYCQGNKWLTENAKAVGNW